MFNLSGESFSQRFGTATFRIDIPKSYDAFSENIVIIKQRVSESLFLLCIDIQFNLVFSHSSVETGIRESKVNLREFDFATPLIVALRWSKNENYLFMSKLDKCFVRASRAEQKGGKIRFGSDGSLYQIGDVGMDVAYYRAVQDGKDVLLPMAKEVWDSTIIKVNVLIDGCKLKDFLFETTLVQQCIVMLVTGLEVYTKNRFSEMEKKGEYQIVKRL
jgi:hypothetical protein